MLAELIGERSNRRHRPGRGFEALRYRFEVVSDYGAFRDLQRHRMLTVQWQSLGPELGAGVPEELEGAGVAGAYREGLERSRAEYARIDAAGRPELAPYALCLGFRIRYVLDMNAREAMHLIELRSGREGHPAYRAVAHALHAEIARVHPAVAAAMSFVDRDTEPRLERILSEIRAHARRAALHSATSLTKAVRGAPTTKEDAPVKQRSNRLLIGLVAVLAVSLMTAALAMAATIIGDDGPNDLTGTDERDRIFAKGGDDTVSAKARADLVRAGLGNDTVNGGRGRDFIGGGDGNDNLDGDRGHDFIRGGLGDDTVKGGGGNPGRRGDVLHGNAGNDNVAGGAGYDLITGNAGTDTLNGGIGCDRIFAGPDNDVLDGGAGNNFRRFRCERLHGGAGDDVANGGVGRDFMSGGRDNDTQNGGGGSDKIYANQGRDKSDGGDGHDVLWALSRKDVTAIGDLEGDELTGGEGRDRFLVRDGEQDIVHCGNGRDQVLADQFDQIDADCERVLRRDITSLDQVEDEEENRTEEPAEDNDE